MAGTLKRTVTFNPSAEKRLEKKIRIEDDIELKKEAKKDLLKFLMSFERGYELQATDEIEQDQLGTINWSDNDGKRMSCAITTVGYLLDNDEIDLVNEESDVKMFTESGAKIWQFAEMMEQLAAKLLVGAELARKAGIHNVKEADYEDEEDEDKDEEDLGDDEKARQVDENVKEYQIKTPFIQIAGGVFNATCGAFFFRLSKCSVLCPKN